MMKKICVNLPSSPPNSYPILINSGLLKSLASWIPKNPSFVVIITDSIVKKHYAKSLVDSLKKEGYRTLLLSFPSGEQAKNIHTKSALEEKMLKHGCDRDTIILALGGGVVGDLAGFIAATFMRGISYIQIPTTLLAMLDSSVGGKTAINTAYGKNLIGAYWQPKAVISDIHCLKTLNTKNIVNGLIEAIKIFLISDINSLKYLEKNLDSILNLDEKNLINLIGRAVKIKSTIVSHDEKENGQRSILNFGHTIGHALEKISDYQLLHGYAVAYGILVEAKISELMGLLSSHEYLLIKLLLKRLKIKTSDLKKWDIDQLIHHTKSDKKNRSGSVNYVLLKSLGSIVEKQHHFTHPISDELVKSALLETIKD